MSLIAHWKMDDNLPTTDVVDSIGDNNGTAQQNTEDISVTGKINRALSFNGVDDYINLGTDYSTSFPLGNNPRTVTFWTYINNDDVGYGLVGYGESANLKEFSIAKTSSNDLRVHRYGGTISLSDNNTLLAGKWTFVAVTYNGTHATGFIDGIKQKTVAVSLDIGSSLSAVIGVRAHGKLYKLNGSIDDVRVYNSTLTPDEITELFSPTPKPNKLMFGGKYAKSKMGKALGPKKNIERALRKNENNI